MSPSRFAIMYAVGGFLIHALAVMYIWLFLFVPLGVRPLRMRDAIAVSFFFHFFIAVHKLSNDEHNSSYQFLTTTIHAFVCVLLAMFYSIALL